MYIAVLGLGEAGSIYALDLAQRGVTVVAFDPLVATAPDGVSMAPSVADAVRGVDIVVSLVGARAAASVLEAALPSMGAATVYADLNTGGPEAKRSLAALAEARGISFVDVAILAPVPRSRIETPLLLSGSGAARLLTRFQEIEIPATDVGTEAGLAASLKLLRSVFMKGLAGLVFESLSAADTIGARDWVQQQIASELGPDGDELVRHLLDGTSKHAVRREAEMRDAQAYLESLGSPSWMTAATIDWLHKIAGQRDAVTTPGPADPRRSFADGGR
ncbi:NAD(P)-dependent oxidoreductase [Cryobacterium sp. Hh7]|uniref:NAD(P)-dependent oxidoreductase n=1 Tax=Cryobacterium sp. Hh7 TaxID=1259159 RepID=UPI00106CE49D|nr:NAD(P)-dependent oxidoreductase [Cryobacterium sp. Hh7]TFD59684.1 NAD(P)-dependent oxidoreductase [Cryobacterium sp. Hh7]